jgi:hypothetical protein
VESWGRGCSERRRCLKRFKVYRQSWSERELLRALSFAPRPHKKHFRQSCPGFSLLEGLQVALPPSASCGKLIYPFAVEPVPRLAACDWLPRGLQTKQF